MCTAATYRSDHFYFGRNLDYEFGYGERVLVIPRNFPFTFKHMPDKPTHYAMIGMGIVENGYPHLFDGMNEKGIGMAGLNFVGNAVYHPVKEGKNNIAQYEFMNYVLSSCGTMEEVRELLSNMNLDDETYSNAFPVAQLHWIIASETDCVVVESMKDGLHVHDNPVGVLTNNPPFETQRFLLNQYMALSNRQPVNTFGKDAELSTYSRGMGTIGLPGDLSSSGRFAKVAFTKLNASYAEGETESVAQFFHILHSVEQQKGCCEVAEGKFEYTLYSSCMDTNTGTFYYTTYNNPSITGVNMYDCDLEGTTIYQCAVESVQTINMRTAK